MTGKDNVCDQLIGILCEYIERELNAAKDLSPIAVLKTIEKSLLLVDATPIDGDITSDEDASRLAGAMLNAAPICAAAMFSPKLLKMGQNCIFFVDRKSSVSRQILISDTNQAGIKKIIPV